MGTRKVALKGYVYLDSPCFTMTLSSSKCLRASSFQISPKTIISSFLLPSPHPALHVHAPSPHTCLAFPPPPTTLRQPSIPGGFRGMESVTSKDLFVPFFLCVSFVLCKTIIHALGCILFEGHYPPFIEGIAGIREKCTIFAYIQEIRSTLSVCPLSPPRLLFLEPQFGKQLTSRFLTLMR